MTLEVKNISKTIRKKPILVDVSLGLETGKIYGFLGRNGSGKTMLFRALTGLMTIDSGEIRVFGKTLGKDISFPQDLGLMMDGVGLWPQYTAFENLKMLAEIKKIVGKDEIFSALKRVGLDPEDTRRYRQYSLGMKQKLGIAQAIMERPKVLVLDEPTNSLDDVSVGMLRSLLIEERSRGCLILIASHNKEDIEVLCDSVYKMQDGQCEYLR